MENTSNENKGEAKYIVESPFNKNKKFNLIEAFHKIQKALKEDKYLDDANISIDDQIYQKMATFNMALNGIHFFQKNNEVIGEDEFWGLIYIWKEIQELLELRIENQTKIWNLAFHGSEER